MARLDSNASAQPDDPDRNLLDFCSTPNAGFGLSGAEVPSNRLLGELSAGNEIPSLSLLPFYNGDTGVQLQAKPAALSDFGLSALDVDTLPGAWSRNDLATSQRFEDLNVVHDRLLQRCAQLEMQAAAQSVRISSYADTIENMCKALSEDVRGPLRWITGFSQLLLAKPTSPADESNTDYSERIIKAAAQLEKFVQDLLKYGRINLQPTTLEPTSAETCVCTVLGELTGVIGARLAEVNIENPLPMVRADAALLRLVFAQLIDNALKFVAPEKTPRIRIWAQTGPVNARIYVEDNGVGIPAAQLERIFGLFQRLGEEPSGTGIGLTLVQKAMEKMGGGVGVESKPGQGSQFWIELPKAG